MLAALALAAWPATAFKEQDFQTKCADVAFCNRMRNVQQPGYSVQAGSVRFAKDSISATLRNTAAGKDFSLQLSAYQGILRVRLLEPGNPRYEVPDVLMPGLQKQQLQRSDKGSEEQLTFSISLYR